MWDRCKLYCQQLSSGLTIDEPKLRSFANSFAKIPNAKVAELIGSLFEAREKKYTAQEALDKLNEIKMEIIFEDCSFLNQKE